MLYQTTLDFGQPTVATGEQLRDLGIATSVDNANTIDPGWSLKAFNILLEFIAGPGGNGTFMTENIRSYAEKRGFIAPSSSRAWGGPMVKAKNAGLIESVGLAPVNNAKAHKANATVWRVRIDK